MSPAIDQVAHKYRALNCNSIATGLADLLTQAEANEISYLAFADQLAARGHLVLRERPGREFGGAQAVLRLPDGYCAASDPRKDGQAAGY